MKKFILSCFCLVAMALHAHDAAALTGKDLAGYCSAKDTASTENIACSAYIHGFIDGMIMGYTAHGTVRGYCPPVTGVSVAQGRAIIENFLREHPEKLKTESGILAGLALSEAFPCKSGK